MGAENATMEQRLVGHCERLDGMLAGVAHAQYNLTRNQLIARYVALKMHRFGVTDAALRQTVSAIVRRRLHDMSTCCQQVLPTLDSCKVQGVDLTGRYMTGPPCSRGAIIRLEAAWRHPLAFAGETACRPAVECYRPRQTTDDDRHQRPLLVCRRISQKNIPSVAQLPQTAKFQNYPTNFRDHTFSGVSGNFWPGLYM